MDLNIQKPGLNTLEFYLQFVQNLHDKGKDIRFERIIFLIKYNEQAQIHEDVEL